MDCKNIQDFLNNNIWKIGRIECYNSFVYIIMDDGTIIDIMATDDCELEYNVIRLGR